MLWQKRQVTLIKRYTEMNYLKYMLLLFSLLVLSCLEGKKNSNEGLEKEQVATNTKEGESRNVDIKNIKEKMCAEFPKELVLNYNPDATHIDIESIDNGSGGILHCNVKLFYGEKEYEYWKGQVSASINQMKDPFWQYNPERNPTLYHKIDGLGERSVYISNMYQLLILKDGVLYSIVPPNRGRTTNTGKENKEIAIEIANHYNL